MPCFARAGWTHLIEVGLFGWSCYILSQTKHSNISLINLAGQGGAILSTGGRVAWIAGFCLIITVEPSKAKATTDYVDWLSAYLVFNNSSINAHDGISNSKR